MLNGGSNVGGHLSHAWLYVRIHDSGFMINVFQSPGKFNNKVSLEENEKLGMYDAGDAAVNICLKKHHHDSSQDKDKIYTSQSDFDWYKVHFGSLTVYRFQITCDCKKVDRTKRCSRFLPMSQQGWGGYMGTLGNSYYLPRN